MWGALACIDAAVDDHILTDGVAVADGHVAVVTLPAEVLRGGRDDASLVEFVVLADACSFEYRHVGTDHASVAYLHVLVDVGKCTDCYILAYLCLRMYKC